MPKFHLRSPPNLVAKLILFGSILLSVLLLSSITKTSPKQNEISRSSFSKLSMSSMFSWKKKLFFHGFNEVKFYEQYSALDQFEQKVLKY